MLIEGFDEKLAKLLFELYGEQEGCEFTNIRKAEENVTSN